MNTTQTQFSDEQLRHLDLNDERSVKEIWKNFPHLHQEFRSLGNFKGYIKALQERKSSCAWWGGC